MTKEQIIESIKAHALDSEDKANKMARKFGTLSGEARYSKESIQCSLWLMY